MQAKLYSKTLKGTAEIRSVDWFVVLPMWLTCKGNQIWKFCFWGDKLLCEAPPLTHAKKSALYQIIFHGNPTLTAYSYVPAMVRMPSFKTYLGISWIDSFTIPSAHYMKLSCMVRRQYTVFSWQCNIMVQLTVPLLHNYIQPKLSDGQAALLWGNIQTYCPICMQKLTEIDINCLIQKYQNAHISTNHLST